MTKVSILSAVLGTTLVTGVAQVAIAGHSGLDQRPDNATCIAPDRPASTADVTAQQVFANLSIAGLDPISMSQPPGDPARWFLAGRGGQVYSFDNDDAVTTKQLILDISDRMQFTDTDFSHSEQWGLTSFALHPDFPTTPYMYVAYNAKPTANDPVLSNVARFTSTDGGQTFDSTSELNLISFTQQSSFHHVGQLLFGPDEYLFIGMGDGKFNSGLTAQDLDDLRGSILRIDIDQGSPYAIPPDNPLVGSGHREEIYASGWRNPWRFTFDRATGQLVAGEVGQATWEEINFVVPGGNFGWPIMEGAHCREPNCDTTGLIPPMLEIEHPTARAIIAGYVYRGSRIPSLQGTFLFGDGTKRDVRGLFYDLQGQPYWDVVADTLAPIANFAESLDGEIYFFNWTSPLQIYTLVPANTPSGSAFPTLLSETGCVDPLDPASPASGVIPYAVNAPLWSDGAEKGRWLALPNGETIDIVSDGDFVFPIGTVLIKSFSFNSMPVETRLFVRHDDGGWGGYSYEWNEDLSDAVLLPAGKVKQITPEITWTYPSRDQCLQCHTDVARFSLGLEISQLNGNLVYPSTMIDANQLDTLEHIGMFTNGLPDQPANLPALASPMDSVAPVERKARSYLHSNCSGCHRPFGPVQSSADFRFATSVESMGVCNIVPNLGDLGIPGARLLLPGDPAHSIISARMNSLDMNRMPPLGTAIIDLEGTGIIDAWISQPDVCVMYPDTDGDAVRDNVDNCTMVENEGQFDTDGDGIGNRCDPDVAMPNNCNVDFLDLNVYRANFFQSGHLDTDNNGDGLTNFADLNIAKEFFFGPPGPSAVGCN